MGITAAIIGGAAFGAVASKALRPKVPNPPPEPEAKEPEKAAVDAAAKQRRRTRAMGNRSGTVLTGQQGVATGQTYQGTTLLGE